MAEVNPQWSNFEGLVKEVLEYGFNDGPQVNKKRIEGWINDAQQQIARNVDAAEFQETEIITLTKGVYQVALPENFLRSQDIFFPSLLQRLRPVDLQQFDTMAHGEVGIPEIEGPPEYYTLYKKELWLFPIPSEPFKIELRYFAKPPYMTTPTAVPVLNPDYWYLLIKFAVVRAFEAEDDFEMAAQHSNRYKADLDQYASDVQFREKDRPHTVDGTWGAFGTTGMRGVI